MLLSRDQSSMNGNIVCKWHQTASAINSMTFSMVYIYIWLLVYIYMYWFYKLTDPQIPTVCKFCQKVLQNKSLLGWGALAWMDAVPTTKSWLNLIKYQEIRKDSIFFQVIFAYKSVCSLLKVISCFLMLRSFEAIQFLSYCWSTNWQLT